MRLGHNSFYSEVFQITSLWQRHNITWVLLRRFQTSRAPLPLRNHHYDNLKSCQANQSVSIIHYLSKKMGKILILFLKKRQSSWDQSVVEILEPYERRILDQTNWIWNWDRGTFHGYENRIWEHRFESSLRRSDWQKSNRSSHPVIICCWTSHRW